VERLDKQAGFVISKEGCTWGNRVSSEALMAEEEARFLDKEDLEKALGAALAKGAEFAEVYLERRTTDTVRIEEQVVREASRGITVGAGVRAIAGDKVGYAYTDGMEAGPLLEAAKVAAEISTEGGQAAAVSLPQISQAKAHYHPEVFPISIEAARKIQTARSADEGARQYDKRITEALIALLDTDKSVLIANSQGNHVRDRQIIP
jgi:TldD protein